MWSRIRIREMHGEDRHALRAVFDGMSPTSRQRRFHQPMTDLTARFEQALLDLDGWRHVALVAEAGPRRGRAPVGIARYVREPDDRAEVAIEVVDAWQGRGVGTRLVRDLARRARAAGVRELYGDVLTDNDAVQRMLRRQPAAVRVQDRGGTRHVRGQLDSTMTVEDVLVDLGRSGWFPMR